MPDQPESPRYLDPQAPLAERIDDLLSRMTLEEKVQQMMNAAAGIPRLGVPDYDWWTECLHGVARAGRCTVFPQAIGMAASFNAPLLEQVAAAIADEARAKHHQAARQGSRLRYQGLTCWSPNINIARDPRWGRIQETYGEDPYLTARMGVAFCCGLQGDDPFYFKTIATPKHFAAHSGPESKRHVFNAEVSPRDLSETYFPAFKACIQEAGAYSVMGAYSRTNGESCSASKALLQDVLRGQWGFEGYVVSDCGAIANIHARHGLTKDAAESAALAVKNGCDLNCGGVYRELIDAVDRDLITEAEIDVAVRRLLAARFRLGMFDPDDRVPYAQIPPDVVDCAGHRALARRMACETMVLLKNEDDLLPLPKDLKRIAVVGPNVYRLKNLLGNYYGYSSNIVSPIEGIAAAVSEGTILEYKPLCELSGEKDPDVGAAKWFANWADVVIAFMGYSPELEGEEGEVADSDGGGDRAWIGLPGRQEELLKALVEAGNKVVLVLSGGSPLAIQWAKEHVPAILMAWYPGEEGGNAIADVLFGDYNPAGRLPVTFVEDPKALPHFDNYSMTGRTYRFSEAVAQYPFGYGLSYTTFTYSGLRLSKAEIAPDETIDISATVTNTGTRAGDEVVQLYVTDLEASVRVPKLHLEGFRRVHLEPGSAISVTFTLTPQQMAAYDDAGAPFVEPGEFRISIGGGQPGHGTAEAVGSTFRVTARA